MSWRARKGIVRLLLVLVLVCPVVAAAAELTIAIDKNFPPFEFKAEGGQYTGFDIDLWEAIAQTAKISYHLRPVNFNDIIPGLQSEQFDAAIAGMTIKPERLAVIDFSQSYYNSGLQILVRSDNRTITAVADLSGKVVATKFGTTSAEFIQQNTAPKDLKLFPNTDAMFLELLSGGTDAVIFDSPVIADFMRQRDDTLLKTVGPLYMQQEYAIAFPKGSPLRTKVNNALQHLRRNGSYNMLYYKWFGSAPR